MNDHRFDLIGWTSTLRPACSQ